MIYHTQSLKILIKPYEIECVFSIRKFWKLNVFNEIMMFFMWPIKTIYAVETHDVSQVLQSLRCLQVVMS